jgi:hypothetical protein
MVIVPVTPLATGPTPGDAPTCNPLGPTGEPGFVPSEEVAPSGGIVVLTWANAGLAHSKGQAAATINNGLMRDSPTRAKELRRAQTQAPQSVRQREALIFLFHDR